MNKELTKEEAEEYYNKLWLENKDLIQENIGKIHSKCCALEMLLIDKDEEIERLNNQIKEYGDLDNHNKSLYEENKILNNIINELEKDLKGKIDEDRLNILSNSHWKYVLDKLQELKGSDKE